MSFIRWIPPQPRGRSWWHLFPLAVIASMGVVIAVNAGMVYAALHSFPGAAGGDEGFALSNHYNQVLDQVQQEAALGWTLLAQSDAAGRTVVTLKDRGGAPLRGASVAATAERPVGALETQALTFREIDAGRYVADANLPMPGQWELNLSASTGGRAMAATRRVIVQ